MVHTYENLENMKDEIDVGGASTSFIPMPIG